jgi:8-oxo-dGTP pyrophosphatase MutT (NUDIX family)
MARTGSRLEITPDPLDALKPSAVLALLYPVGGSPHVLLTLRPAHLRRHAGQISLPGGRFEPGDETLLTTALRETTEELGIDTSDFEVWGWLEGTIVTVSQYRVTPFVAYVPERPIFRPDPAEVAAVIEMPLQVVTDPLGLSDEVWELAGGPRRISFYPFGGHKVWGATARILSQLGQLIDEQSPRPLEL